MEQLFDALANDRRIAILGELVGGRASQAQLREVLGVPASQKGTLKKDVDVLVEAHVVVRAGDLYELVEPDGVQALLQQAADLDAALSAELARRMQARARDAEGRARSLRKDLMARRSKAVEQKKRRPAS
jgi:hypothetical protein